MLVLMILKKRLTAAIPVSSKSLVLPRNVYGIQTAQFIDYSKGRCLSGDTDIPRWEFQLSW